MAKQTRIESVIGDAIEKVNAEIVNRALAAIPQSATMGEIIDGFKAADFAAELNSLSVKDFMAAVGAVPKKRGPGRPKGSTAKADKPATKTMKGRARNTRTAAGREELVRDVFAVLSANGGQLGAETIRAEVGGESPQVRRALQSLVDQKMVKRQGQARGTEYHVA
ncbi:MAG: hypothetical protein V3W41_08975 [Planctomycetota bacterium]